MIVDKSISPKKDVINTRDMTQSRYFLHCITAGCSAALAGVSAKLISTPTVLPTTTFLSPLIRTSLGMLALVTCNLLMWLNYSTALQGMRTVTATAATTTANFILSGVVGWAVFGEPLVLTWWFGISLIVVGVVLLTSEQSVTSKSKED